MLSVVNHRNLKVTTPKKQRPMVSIAVRVMTAGALSLFSAMMIGKALNGLWITHPGLKIRGLLDKLVKGWTKEHTAEEVMNLLQSQEVAAGVVQDASDLASDPQLRAGDFFIELEHPELGRTISDATPIKLSDTPARYRRSAPLSGQDNSYVYGELLGMSQAELTRLKQQGII